MNKEKLVSYRSFIWVLILLVSVLSGCASNIKKTSVALDGTPEPSQVIDLSITNTRTLTIQPTMTITKLSPTAQPTWTALPTIRPEKIDSFIESMKDKCELPCWGNIIPGQTDEWEAKQIISSFGTVVESTSVYFDYQKQTVVIDFTYRDGIVASINLSPELTTTYKLGNLLTQFGEPEDVRIVVIPETAEGTPWYYLAVYYPQTGLLAVFSGEGKIINSKVSVCFESVSPDLYLVASNLYSLEQMDTILDRTLRNMLEPLTSITEINKEQFYAIYSQKTVPCLTTTINAP